MKILFKTDGGFGYFPGLNKPLELDSNELPPEEETLLKQLISQANFFDLPSQASEPSQGADMRKYLIKVEENDREHWIQFSDNYNIPHLQDLVNYLSKKRREKDSGE